MPLCEVSTPDVNTRTPDAAPASSHPSRDTIAFIGSQGPSPRGPQKPRHASRQEERYQDEQEAQQKEPVLGQGLGKPALPEIDQSRAEHRPEQRAASADRGPDGDLDRVGWRHLARIDDADLRDV